VRKEIESKYLWLIKIQVAMVLYILIFSLSKLLGLLELNFIYPILLILYFLFSKRIDSYLLNEWIYVLTAIASGGILIGLRPGRIYAPKVVFNFYGYTGILLLLLIFVNSFLIFKKVLRYSWWELMHGRKE
jgi:hypothetical protein